MAKLLERTEFGKSHGPTRGRKLLAGTTSISPLLQHHIVEKALCRGTLCNDFSIFDVVCCTTWNEVIAAMLCRRS